MTTTPGIDVSGFERKLARIVETSETEAEEQSGLLLELVREVHTVKWILWWVLIIVPALVVTIAVVGGIMLTTLSPSAAPNAITYGH
jgi:hypothetical protein